MVGPNLGCPKPKIVPRMFGVEGSNGVSNHVFGRISTSTFDLASFFTIIILNCNEYFEFGDLGKIWKNLGFWTQD